MFLIEQGARPIAARLSVGMAEYQGLQSNPKPGIEALPGA